MQRPWNGTKSNLFPIKIDSFPKTSHSKYKQNIRLASALAIFWSRLFQTSDGTLKSLRCFKCLRIKKDNVDRLLMFIYNLILKFKMSCAICTSFLKCPNTGKKLFQTKKVMFVFATMQNARKTREKMAEQSEFRISNFKRWKKCVGDM
jgi:hypothetical protein